MAKIVRFHRPGGPEVLQIEDIRVADPQEGEVRIRVEAVGLNRAEAVYREGHYWMQPELPSLIGYEASGVVEEIGPGVAGFSVGDYVSSIPAFSMCKYGTYGEVAVLPAYALTSYPPNLSPIEGAAIWMQYLTAFGLIELGNMRPGDRVLITAASSSVGLAAIQLANAVGAIPIATTRNQHKEQALKKAGAAFVINTKESQWVSRIHEVTSGKGVDLAFDAVAGPDLEKLTQVVHAEGTIFVYGALAREETPFPLRAVIGNKLVIRGFRLDAIVLNPERFTRAKQWVFDNLNSGKIKPVISKTFSLDEVVEAHRFMESNEQIGKIVLTT